VVEEESDESKFWLEMLRDTNKSHAIEIDSLIKEADELTAIFTASGKTAKRNRDNKK